MPHHLFSSSRKMFLNVSLTAWPAFTGQGLHCSAASYVFSEVLHKHWKMILQSVKSFTWPLLLFHLQTVWCRGAATRWQLSGPGDGHVCLPLVWQATLSRRGPQGPEAPRLLSLAQLHHWHGAQLRRLLLALTKPSLQRGARIIST